MVANGYPTSVDQWTQYLADIVVRNFTVSRSKAGRPYGTWSHSLNVLVVAYVDDLVVAGPKEYNQSQYFGTCFNIRISA